MKIAFYFMLKSLFIPNLYLNLLVILKKNGLLRKIRLISEFMTSQPTITIHILSNISRNKGKQTIKFGQLIAYKINIFLRKSCRK